MTEDYWDREENLTDAEKEQVEQLTEKLLDRLGDKDEYGDWDYLSEAIIEVGEELDLDRLRVYDKFLAGPDHNIVLLDIIVDFYRKSGVEESAPLLTKEHLRVTKELGVVLKHETGVGMPKVLMHMNSSLLQIVLDNLHRSDAVLTIISERKVFDPIRLLELLKVMDEQHPAVTNGML